MRQIIVAALLIALSGQAARTGFDADWKFALDDHPGAEASAFNDSEWRTLDLPHDWSIEGDYSKDNPMGDSCGYLPAGIGWYRKTIPVSRDWKNKHVEIAFDGVFMNSTVWANGKKLGTRPYGWISFAYDISDLVQTSETITFAVRVDNEKQPSARWYTGSGIYAHTWIDVKEKVHVAHDGIFIRTKGSAVELDAEIHNTTQSKQAVDVKVSILDLDGKEVAKALKSIPVEPADLQISSFKFQVSNPKRWDIESPNLYQYEVEVLVNGKTSDVAKNRFGFRDIDWKPEAGMWLNGKNVKLQGVCNHQDAGALGAAVPDKVLRFRIEQLKKMGCNAIRTAHNPQTPVFYDLCDELGMLVMDEGFDGWGKKAKNDYGAHYFNDWWERDLTDWIRRDRNHPSVVIYSVGNETRGAVGKDLVARCHELDSTRPVTSGQSGEEFMDVLGMNGASERAGWMSGLRGDKVTLGTENTHTWQVRGYYRTQTWYRDGYPGKQKPFLIPDLTETEVFSDDWTDAAGRANRKQIFNSSYDNATVRSTARNQIEQIRDVAAWAGAFRWTGHDYIGEAGYVHGGWPFKAFMGGAIDLANFEKDLYYLYQSQWTDQPMVHILPHWTHPTIKPGTLIPVWVYSNGDSVELFLNGKSLGRKSPGTKWDEMQCQWLVGWMPGELKAVASRKGTPVAEQVIRTADAPARIALSVDGEPLAAAGKDLVQVRVTTQDEKGEFYPCGENRTFFRVIGPGKIRALDNGSPIDDEKHFEASSRIAFYGLTRAYVESTGEPGDITLMASCILGEKKQVTSGKVSIDVQRIALRGALPSAKVEIFYTVDGSAATQNSTRYTGSFSVPLGTTVKALVVVDGQPFQTLEERFAADEGFVWNAPGRDSSAVASIGEQAESAKFEGAAVSKTGSAYQGPGYLDFGHNKGAFVEFYQENDGEAGNSDLTIRYSGNAKGKPGRFIQISVNGVVTHPKLLLPNAQDWGSDWKTVTVSIPLGRGANAIRLTTVESGGMYLDQILVR
jgi:beta-galactosidase